MTSQMPFLFPSHEIDAIRPRAKRPSGGSSNPIVFHDYESYIAKFQSVDKTTDDTYTPKDVYEAVLQYVGTIYDLADKAILRPFYPGGDFENAEYPEKIPFGFNDDNKKYLMSGVAVVTSVFALCGGRAYSVALGIIIAIMIAFAKECYDHYKKELEWSWSDVVWMLIGGFCGGIISTIAYIINH